MVDSGSKEGLSFEDQAALFTKVVEILRRQRNEGLTDELSASLSEARQSLEAFCSAHPKSIPGLRLLAEVSHGLGDMESTRKYIDAAEILDPWNPEILIISESIYEANARSSPKEPGAPPSLESGLTEGSLSSDMLIERAMGSFKLGEFDRAYSLAKLVYRIDPQNGHHLLDVWSIGAGVNPERVRRELMLLLQEVVTEPYLYLAMGSIDNVLGLYDEAISWLEKGLDQKEMDPYVHSMLLNELAYVFAKTETRLNRALALARKALAFFPEEEANGFIRDTLGVIYMKLGQVDKAIRNLREAVSKDSTVIPRFHLAVAMMTNGDYAEALTQLHWIASARPSLESPHVEESTILDRVQTNINRLDELLNLGSPDDIKDAQSLLRGLL